MSIWDEVSALVGKPKRTKPKKTPVNFVAVKGYVLKVKETLRVN